MTCQYCGKTSWWSFKRATGGEFCSREHRDSYHERLRKVAGRLSEYQDIPTEGVGAAVAAVVSVTQEELSSLPNNKIFPIIECVPATAELARETEAELSEMMREADATAATREFVPLRIGDGSAGLGVWLPIPVLPAPGAPPAIQSVTAMVTPAFENYAQIKRWGLRIKFLKS